MNKIIGGVFGLLLLMSSSANAVINDLFISEYVEGSGYNKAIELYNGRTHTINLSEYKLTFYLNGSTIPNFSVELSGYLPAHTTFVLANTLASSEVLLVTDQTHDGIWFNGDDVVVLTHKDEIIDSIGQVGLEPGTLWGKAGDNEKYRSLRRISSIATPDTDIHDEVDLGSQWIGVREDNFDGLGTYIKYSARACTETKRAMWICNP